MLTGPQISIRDDGNAEIVFVKDGKVSMLLYHVILQLLQVVESMVISGDGQRVSIQSPQQTLEVPLAALSHKHHARYRYAAQFCTAIRKVTPRVTLYKPDARARVGRAAATVVKLTCTQLCESGDFDCLFRDGRRVRIDSSTHAAAVLHEGHVGMVESDASLDTRARTLYAECRRIEQLHAEYDSFPLTIGRRHASTSRPTSARPASALRSHSSTRVCR